MNTVAALTEVEIPLILLPSKSQYLRDLEFTAVATHCARPLVILHWEILFSSLKFLFHLPAELA